MEHTPTDETDFDVCSSDDIRITRKKQKISREMPGNSGPDLHPEPATSMDVEAGDPDCLMVVCRHFAISQIPITNGLICFLIASRWG